MQFHFSKTVAMRRAVIKTVGSHRWAAVGEAWYGHYGEERDGRGNLRENREDPAPTAPPLPRAH